jgi:cell wall assembly regulator SMI1
MENINDLFQTLANDVDLPKSVKFVARDLTRTFNVKSNSSIEQLRDLAYWLYLFNRVDYARMICSTVDSEELGNAERDTWLQPLFILHCRILREEGDIENAKKQADKVLANYATGQKLLRRLLKGSLLYDDKIKACEEENNVERANSWKFLQFIRLCFIRELGGSEELPVDAVEKQLCELKSTLPELRKIQQIMEEYWNRIKKWLEQNDSGRLKLLQKGADSTEINLLESTIGVKLPEDFVLFYSIHNGQTPYSKGIIIGEELLSTERILDEWNIWKALIDSNEFTDINGTPDAGIKNDWYNKSWIPITCDGAGNHYCLDLDPAGNGVYGQIIRVWHDDGTRTLEADSFRKWISYFVEDLEDGRYC